MVEAPGSPEFKLALVGDSAAAGIGVSTHSLGLGGSLARELAVSTGRRVEWRVFAQSIANVQRIRQRLIPQLPVDHDLVVLIAGMTDALAATPIDEWSIDIGAAIADLAVRHRCLLVVGTPPFAQMPCLPSPLREALDERGRAMDAVTAEFCAGRPGVVFSSGRTLPDETDGFFAVDGFHPSARAYARWARSLARTVG
ncbi:SGNH/GDSL hydrolase family protein [Ammonicoccus fulvus]|uniref:SGNH/GDSL hydrolase family protein n=1 Tax=Ammonicoccus fulvus TaxID=3138240 RepID=A0ABZ3FST2_9ACTN